jgi:RimJ/RimL family protein N-acetyltransferase
MVSLWSGKKVRLRALSPEIAAHWAASADDVELQRLGWQTMFPYNEARRRRGLEKAQEKDDAGSDDCNLMIESLAGQVVGTVGMHATDRRHRTADLHVGLDDRRHWGHGYASEAIRLLLRFTFRELGYAKVNLNVYAYNTRAIGLYERLGFVHEGRIRGSIYTAGRRWDDLLMGMTRAEYEAQHAVWFPDDRRPTMDDGR